MSLLFRPGLSRKLEQPGMRFARLNRASWIALGVLIVLALAAVLAPVISPYEPNALSTDTGGPSAAHWFGVDNAGRDIFTRLVYGTRWSLAIGLLATLFALVLGATLGALAATSKKWIDELVMRVLDVVMAFPGIALAAVLVAVFGRAIPVLIMAIGFLYIPQVTRIVRANVLAQYGEDYVAAERTIGAKRAYILTKHVAVNCAAPILVFCTILVADAIVFESSLSFIGAGIQPPDPSWGSVLSDGKDLVLLGGWWATLFPGLLILITVLSLNVIAEGAADAWAAPSARPTKTPTGAAAASVTSDADAATLDPDVVDDPLEAAAPVTTALPVAALQAAAARIAQDRPDLSDRETVLDVQDLTISFPGRHNGVNVVDGVSFSVRRGEVLGLIGESGCGKSLTSLAIMGLEPRTAVIGGRAMFAGQDLLTLSPRARRAHMGHDLAMIYQDALSSLNPGLTVGAQLKQVISRGGKRDAQTLMELVNLDPERTLRAYPHELSGGQRQRVLIALALARNPQVIVADEPTTALDVTVQAQVMALLLRLQEELGFALILVSHDLALIADHADQIVVMYGGRVVESGSAAQIIGSPEHHYTRGLLASVVSLEGDDESLSQIRGVVPSPAHFSPGCRFVERCPAARDICAGTSPALDPVADGHLVSCHFPALVEASS